MRVFLLWFVVVAMVEGLTFYLGLQWQDVYWIFHLYAPVEYALVAWVFSHWHHSARFKNIVLSSIPIFLLICAWDLADTRNLTSLDDFTASVAHTLFIAISSFVLLGIQRQETKSLIRDYRFWVSSGLLLYSSGSLAYFALNDTLVVNPIVLIWVIHAVLNIVAYSMYSVGFICRTSRLEISGA